MAICRDDNMSICNIGGPCDSKHCQTAGPSSKNISRFVFAWKSGLWLHETHFLFLDFDISQFWAWDDFNSYLTFILSLGLVMAVLTVIFTFSTWYFEIVGAIALTIEASLGMPQALKNFKQKSTEGLSNILIISWLFGDIGKCLYFWYISAPFQFMACGLFQISMDLFILGQIMFYLRTSGGVDKPKV